jgi:hypothetical protein
MDDLNISKNGAEIGGKDHYLDISWNEWAIEIEVFESNGYDENQASSITLNREQFDAIISAYQNK